MQASVAMRFVELEVQAQAECVVVMMSAWRCVEAASEAPETSVECRHGCGRQVKMPEV